VGFNPLAWLGAVAVYGVTEFAFRKYLVPWPAWPFGVSLGIFWFVMVKVFSHLRSRGDSI